MDKKEAVRKSDAKRSAVAAVVAGILISGIGKAGRAQEAAPAPLPVWKPQTTLVRYLARSARVLKYALQPPAGYAARQTQRPGLQATTWRGAASQTGITPNVTLALAPAPLVNGKPYTPERLIVGALGSLKRGHDNWTQTDIEQGKINGITFARAYWTGTERQHKRKVRGVSYMAVDGPTLISLQSQDMALATSTTAKPNASSDAPPTSDAAPTANPPNANAPDINPADGLPSNIDRLKLAEAAILTFRRYAAPKPVAPDSPTAP